MKAVLEYIKGQRKQYEQLPFFEFMKDKKIDPRQRLAFAPCFAHFVMSFGDLNKYVFRDESSCDPVQKLINHHTYEDAHHWPLFLEDLDKLGFNTPSRFGETLKFLWSKETQLSRQLTYELIGLTLGATPVQKLIVIESIEATGNVFLSITSQVARELSTTTHQEYRYFGDFHFARETGHLAGSGQSKETIEQIALTSDEYQQGLEIVDRVFQIFTNSTHELLRYAQNSESVISIYPSFCAKTSA